jgi:hypothetical protein
MPLTFYTMLALVQEFLPHMLEGDGATLTAQGGVPTVDPEHLAGLLWTMHGTKSHRDAVYP